jgi:hypothetical protein
MIKRTMLASTARVLVTFWLLFLLLCMLLLLLLGNEVEAHPVQARGMSCGARHVRHVPSIVGGKCLGDVSFRTRPPRLHVETQQEGRGGAPFYHRWTTGGIVGTFCELATQLYRFITGHGRVSSKLANSKPIQRIRGQAPVKRRRPDL